MSKEKVQKYVFTTKDADGKEVEIAVKRPTSKQIRAAQLEYSSMFARLIQRDEPAILREALDDVMRKQGLWDDEKQNAYESLQDRFGELEKMLAAGGIPLKEAKDAALEMLGIRSALTQFRASRNALDSLTAQGIAENHSRDYLIYECTVDNKTGKKCFASIDDFQDRLSANEPMAYDAFSKYMNFHYGVDDDATAQLPEYKFLKKFKFVDEKLRLIDKQGNLVDALGRRVNEDNQLIDDEGNLIDEDGNRISETGDYMVDTKPFLDDEGNPIQDS